MSRYSLMDNVSVAPISVGVSFYGAKSSTCFERLAQSPHKASKGSIATLWNSLEPTFGASAVMLTGRQPDAC
jgi:hypothetical protein